MSALVAKKVPFWIFILIAIVYFTATRVDTMDIDASQYAEISREMMKSGDYLHVYDRGADYLDKPPLLFWLSAASMRVFGVNNFGYKLPSVLFALLALFATYKLAKRLYDENTGLIAALVLATAQGMFLMTNDIRCDTLLMSWVITSIWLIQEWVLNRKTAYLLGGCAAIAFGMLSKGPIALLVPVFCFVCDWVLKRQWKNLLQPAYIPGIVIIALLLLPMSIGLWQQFDQHPEKIMDGRSAVSGLRFFYWSQSFGRITGESPWKNAVDFSFLFTNMLWSFLPWILVLVPAIIINIMQLIRQKLRLLPGQEWITTGGFLITYSALASSAYQLPHYIFVAFPLAAIVVARLLQQLISEWKSGLLHKVLRPTLFVASFIILLVALVLLVYVFPATVLAVIGCIAGLGIWIYLLVQKPKPGELSIKLIMLPAVAMLIANIFLTNFVYYRLLQYQAGGVAGRYIKEHHIKSADFMWFKMEDPLNCVHFYADEVLHGTDTLVNLENKKYVLTMDKGLKILDQAGYHFDTLMQGELFKVSELTPGFLNPLTRQNEVKKYYLLKLK